MVLRGRENGMENRDIPILRGSIRKKRTGSPHARTAGMEGHQGSPSPPPRGIGSGPRRRLSCLRLEAPGYCRSLKGALTPAPTLRRGSALLHPTAFPEGCTQAMQAAPEGRSRMHGDVSRTSAPRAAYPASSISSPRPSCHPLKGIHPTLTTFRQQSASILLQPSLRRIACRGPIFLHGTSSQWNRQPLRGIERGM